MRYLHEQRSVTPQLLRTPQVQRYIHTTASVLHEAVDAGIGKAPVSDIMRDRLHHANLVFSGFKTFHQLKEAFPLLTDENGDRKPFNRFLSEVQSIDEQYNVHYLRSEYNFAVGAAQMAAKWEQYEQQSDRYDLQYRTANDEKVRETHSRLHGVTLPVSSRFWEEYFPPNGWGCRCTVVQVRKNKYPASDEKQAIRDGNQSTTGRHAEMFRFNPGKSRAAFPAYNPYTISKCKECTQSGFKLAAKIPDNELCRACAVIREMREEWQKKVNMTQKEADKSVKDWMKKREEKRIVSADNLHTGRLHLFYNAVKRYLGHAKTQEAKWLVTTFDAGVEEMEFQGYEVLGARKNANDPKDAKNIAEKKRRGVIGYTQYLYEYEGKRWVLGFEVVKKGNEEFEQPYYITRKRP